ncbi:MAG: glycosyltransferase [Muribaculaceae bacterium]|nr:glycosyltransferase [Muribaculaceae bacterium]
MTCFENEGIAEYLIKTVGYMISVIVPVYNAEKWLRDALASLQAQSYADFEAILVDDGSTDGSTDICREYSVTDSRFRLIRQSNAGVSAARNAGIDEARGEWIAFMDADDIMPPDALSVMMTHARTSGAGIVAGGYSRGIPGHMPTGEGHSMTVPSDTAILIGLYQMRILNNPWGMLFRSSVFKGERPLRFRRCRYEDLDLFYQAFERTDTVCILDRKVYFYRDTPGSFINSWSEARLDVLDVTDRMAAHMADRSPALFRAAQDRRFSAHFNMLVEMARHGVDNPAQKKRCLDVIKNLRLKEITDGKVRLKNKLGALLSYLGMPAIKLICRSSR